MLRLSAQKGEVVSDVYVSSVNDSLRYQLIIPASIDSAQKYPLVIWLHGKGERGSDNKKQMTLIKKWLPDSLNTDAHKAFLLAPQCPENSTWNSYDKTAKQISFDSVTPSIQKTLTQLLGKMENDYPIDTARIYLIGISMGAFGVFDLITRFPGRFAAAIPICGGGDPSQAEKMKQTPIWAFHGEADKVVDKRHTVQPMNIIQDSSHILTIYPSAGHDVWNKAFKEGELVKWLFRN